jgi:pimeloyl-[acyl-carrier protein] synthase
MDFMGDFAQPLLDSVLGEVFGVPPEVCAHVNRFSSAVATFLGTTDPSREELEAVDREMRTLTEILSPLVEARRRSPRADVITALSDPGRLAMPLEEVALQCSLTLGAGLETAAGLLGNSLLAFLRNPAAVRRVKNDPSSLVEAVEECLRYDSPSQWVPRVARGDLEVNGISVRGQELVWLGLGSANRDPAQFPSPDVFDITRRPKALTSFGGGAHHCLGAHLARLEARVALGVVFLGLTHLELDTDDVSYRVNFGIRCPQSLPIRFGTDVMKQAPPAHS